MQIGDFCGENFHGLLGFAAPKDATLPNFVEKTFANSHKTAKVFSLEIFPLYSQYLAIERLSSLTICCRDYVQPQWVFDCVNGRRLLPVGDYAPGTTLPPHLSPFLEEKEGDYVPPERALQLAEQEMEVGEW